MKTFGRWVGRTWHCDCEVTRSHQAHIEKCYGCGNERPPSFVEQLAASPTPDAPACYVSPNPASRLDWTVAPPVSAVALVQDFGAGKYTRNRPGLMLRDAHALTGLINELLGTKIAAAKAALQAAERALDPELRTHADECSAWLPGKNCDCPRSDPNSDYISFDDALAVVHAALRDIS